MGEMECIRRRKSSQKILDFFRRQLILFADAKSLSFDLLAAASSSNPEVNEQGLIPIEISGLKSSISIRT
jgi:hypothetical protein